MRQSEFDQRAKASSNTMRLTRMFIVMSAALVAAACGGGGGSDKNRSPAATDGMVSTQEDVPVSGVVTGTDPDSDSLKLQIVSAPQKGDVALSATNPLGFTYTPRANQNGADSFTFVVADGKASSNTAMISIAIAPVGDAPVIQTTLAADEDSPVTTQLATEVDGESLTVDALTAPSHGTLTLSATTPGLITYVSATNFNGPDVFRLHAVDANGLESTQDVHVTVKPTNDAPQASNFSVRTRQGSRFVLPVLGNDTDIDGDPLNVSIVSQSPGGTAAVESDGSIRFDPRPGFIGRTAFTYQVADPSGAVSTAQVNVAVALSYVAVFQSDQDTPGTLDLYAADGLSTTRLNTPLQAGETIFDFTTAADAPVIGYRRRNGNVFRPHILDLRQPGVDVDLVPASMPGSVQTILLSADGSKVAFNLEGAWKFVDLAHPDTIRDLGTTSPAGLLDRSGAHFYYADIRFTPSLQPSTMVKLDTAIGPASAVVLTPTFNPPDQVYAPVALSADGRTLYFISSAMGVGIGSADLANPPVSTTIYRALPQVSYIFAGGTPDATSFLFKRATIGRAGVDLVKPATPGNPVDLTQGTIGDGIGDVTLSDDSARLYYLRSDHSSNQTLYEADTANPAVSTLIGAAPNTPFGVANFSLAHDRSRVAFATLDLVPFGSAARTGNADLFLFDLNQRTLSPNLRRFGSFLQLGPYAPDNTFIALVGGDELGETTGKAYVLNVLDPTHLIPLHSSGIGLMPQLVPSPDRRLVPTL